MSDVALTKGLHRAYAIGLSAKGKEWLQENIVGAVETISISIPVDVMDDFKKSLEDQGLKVETR